MEGDRALILDIGAATTRLGFAGDDVPTTLHTQAGCVASGGARESASLAGVASRRHYYGAGSRYSFDFSPPAEPMILRAPVAEGLVEDWDSVEALLQRACVGCGLPQGPGAMRGRNLLLVEHVHGSKADREHWATLLFEKFGIAGFYACRAGVLALYANARTSGITVDCGAGGTQITPVQDGYPLMMGACVHPVGGSAIDAFLHAILQSHGILVGSGLPSPPAHPGEASPRGIVDVHDAELLSSPTRIPGAVLGEPGLGSLSPFPAAASSSSSSSAVKRSSRGGWHSSVLEWHTMQRVRAAKEALARCRGMTMHDEDGALLPSDPGEEGPPLSFVLPDGTPITLSQADADRLGELPFDPVATVATAGLPGAYKPPTRRSLHDAIAGAAMAIDDGETRRRLVENVILTGGASALPGFAYRVEAELAYVAPVGCTPRFAMAPPARRQHGAWLGGSILASIGTISDLWVTKEEWAEQGAKALHRKCG